MTTLQGLFAAGDGMGAAPHKCSSGSFTDGRLAAKAAVHYVRDHPATPTLDQGAVGQLQQTIRMPLETFEHYRGVSTDEEGNPHYLPPKQCLVRLQKIMDEYAAGTSAWYTTNAPTLQRGIELIEMLRADLRHLGARNLHELLRCWELWRWPWVGGAHMRHMLFRQETRWRVFVNSRYDAAHDRWALMTRPYINLATP
jgi:adenylylsulfate reductase subunit A